MNTSDLKSFHYLENGEVAFSMLDTIKTEKILDPNFYKVEYLEYPENRIKLTIIDSVETSKNISFSDKEKLDELLTSFFNENVKIKLSKLGFNHKVGILLYGKEGTGKSTIIKSYYTKFINKEKALVFTIKTLSRIDKCWEFIRQIRRVQNNPIIIIFEEFDEVFKTNNPNEGIVKTILDGDLSIDNCIFFATTNYLENIPVAIKERPSRFKYVLNIEGIQKEEQIYEIIHSILGELFSIDEIKEFSIEMKGQTLDIIKQFCFDKLMDLKSYTKKHSSIGFFKDLK